MSRLLALTLFTAVITITARAETILETVLDPANPQQQNTVLAGRVLIAGHTDSFLLVYNDLSFSRVNFPIVGGRRMRFDTYHNPLTVFRSAVYFALAPTPGSFASRFLYRFSGSTFTRIAISGNMVSNCIVYGSYLYFLCDVSGTTRMFRYDGVSVTELTAADVPRSAGYELHVAGDNLYITGFATMVGTSNFIRKYNGTSFFTLPWTGRGTNVEGVYAIPGTNRVYFTSHERILYYDGRTVSLVFFNTGEGISARMYRNSLYFTTGVGALPGRIQYFLRLTDATLSIPLLPSGYNVAPLEFTNPEVYGDALYIPAVHTDGTTRLLRYDGTDFTAIFDIPTPETTSPVRLYLRQRELIIHPNFPNGQNAVIYNGSLFNEVVAPTDRFLFPYINGTACNHLWLNYYSDATGIHWAYARESKGCPPPPGPGSVPVIPDHFRDYERFEMATYGPERGWCWSEIIIDWDIKPVCELPPCPEPVYGIRMTDANNSMAWSTNFNKPSALTVPLADQQPFKTVLSSMDTKKDLLVFEPGLLPAGIETLKLSFKPKEKYFLLTASTRKNAQVPFTATLYNENGKIIWEQNFIAPLNQQITATVEQPGKLLVFSIPVQGLKSITHAKRTMKLY